MADRDDRQASLGLGVPGRAAELAGDVDTGVPVVGLVNQRGGHRSDHGNPAHPAPGHPRGVFDPGEEGGQGREGVGQGGPGHVPDHPDRATLLATEDLGVSHPQRGGQGRVIPEGEALVEGQVIGEDAGVSQGDERQVPRPVDDQGIEPLGPDPTDQARPGREQEPDPSDRPFGWVPDAVGIIPAREPLRMQEGTEPPIQVTEPNGLLAPTTTVSPIAGMVEPRGAPR